MLCWALRNTEINIVLIGSSQHWPAYAELCRSISGSTADNYRSHAAKLAGSLLCSSRTYTAKLMETCGLVSLEAALSGTPLVGSTFGHELEYLESDAWYADPGDEASLRKAVLAALEAGRQHPRPIRMKRKVLERFNWERTADATECYTGEFWKGRSRAHHHEGRRHQPETNTRTLECFLQRNQQAQSETANCFASMVSMEVNYLSKAKSIPG